MLLMIGHSNAADGLEPPDNNNEDFNFITGMSLPPFDVASTPPFDVASMPDANGGVASTPNLCPVSTGGDQSPGNLQARQDCYRFAPGQIASPPAQSLTTGNQRPGQRGPQKSPIRQARPSDLLDLPVAKPDWMPYTYHEECEKFFGGIFKVAVCDTGDWRPVISKTFLVYELLDCMLISPLRTHCDQLAPEGDDWCCVDWIAGVTSPSILNPGPLGKGEFCLRIGLLEDPTFTLDVPELRQLLENARNAGNAGNAGNSGN